MGCLGGVCLLVFVGGGGWVGGRGRSEGREERREGRRERRGEERELECARNGEQFLPFH